MTSPYRNTAIAIAVLAAAVVALLVLTRTNNGVTARDAVGDVQMRSPQFKLGSEGANGQRPAAALAAESNRESSSEVLTQGAIADGGSGALNRVHLRVVTSSATPIEQEHERTDQVPRFIDTTDSP